MLKELTSFAGFSRVLGQRVSVAYEGGRLTLDLTIEQAQEVLELLGQVEPGLPVTTSLEPQSVRLSEEHVAPTLEGMRAAATGKKPRGRRKAVNPGLECVQAALYQTGEEAAQATLAEAGIIDDAGKSTYNQLDAEDTQVMVLPVPDAAMPMVDPAAIDAQLAQEVFVPADQAEAEALAAADDYLAAQRKVKAPEPEATNYNWVDYNSPAEAKAAEIQEQTVALAKAMEKAAATSSLVPTSIPEKVLTTSKVLDVLYWLHDQGVPREQMNDVCAQLQPKVPVLKRAGGELKNRVERSKLMLELEA